MLQCGTRLGHIKFQVWSSACYYKCVSRFNQRWHGPHETPHAKAIQHYSPASPGAATWHCSLECGIAVWSHAHPTLDCSVLLPVLEQPPGDVAAQRTPQMVNPTTGTHDATQQEMLVRQMETCPPETHTCPTVRQSPEQPFTQLELKYHEVLMSKGDPHTHPCPNRRTAFTYHTIQPQLRMSPPRFAFLAAACTIVPVNDYNRLQVRPHPNVPPVRVPYQNIT
jgi:hypothetical protein